MSNIKKATLAILLIIISLFSTIFTPITAFAEGSSYKKTPLTELSKADNFNVEDFKEDPEDFSIKVIQIAESTEGKLNIFTFQPARNTVDLRASSINISYGYSVNGEDLSPRNYPLRLISTEGCFDKYEVEGFEVRGDEYKYYNIVSIYRRLDERVPTDKDVFGGTTTETAYPVGQQWLARTINGSTTYEMNTFATAEIKYKAIGHLFYQDGVKIGGLNSAIDGGLYSWFIAFDCEEYKIQHIYDATISFKYRGYDRRKETYASNVTENYTYGDWVPITLPIYDHDEVTYEGEGLWSKTFNWNRIMTSTEFNTMFTQQGGRFEESSIDEVNQSQWVFAYLEKPFNTKTSVQGLTVIEEDHGFQVSEVSVLTIKFMDINHKVYNLGVVSDKVTPDDVVDGYADGILGLTNSMKEITAIISSLLGVVGLLILANFCPPLINVLTFVIKGVINGFALVLSLIFKILAIPLELVFNRKRK